MWLWNTASHSPLLVLDLVACADAEICRKICGNPSGCSDIAYPKLVIELLPVGKELGNGAGTDGYGTHQPKGIRERSSERKIPCNYNFSGVYVGLGETVARDSMQQER